MRPHHVLLALLPAALTARSAAAQPWLTAEVPAAIAVSDPHADSFRGGAMPAVGVYGRVAPFMALAVRGRAGVLGDASTSMASSGLVEPRWGGLATVSMAMRVGGERRPWIEGVAGGAITGSDVVPAFEVGAGWMSHVGSVELGPSLRYLHVRDAAGPGLGSAGIVLVGVELRRSHVKRVHHPLAVAPERIDVERDDDRLTDATAASCAGDPNGCAEPDDDTIIDVLETCAVLVEALGDGGDGDGCAAGGLIEVRPDRIILSERVLFAFNRARVRHAARPVLHAIAAAWQSGRWHRIIVEGHADVRGTADYNQWLSALRAERVRDVLVDAGIPASAIETAGYGATRPRSPDNHDLNRRVEFVIVPEVQP